MIKVGGQERQTFEDDATVVLVDTRDDYVEMKKFQEYPSSVPSIQQKPLIRESVSGNSEFELKITDPAGWQILSKIGRSAA